VNAYGLKPALFIPFADKRVWVAGKNCDRSNTCHSWAHWRLCTTMRCRNRRLLYLQLSLIACYISSVSVIVTVNETELWSFVLKMICNDFLVVKVNMFLI